MEKMEILRKVRADGIVISRVPKPTRDKFITMAEDEFAGDYGMLLKYLYDRSILFGLFLEGLGNKSEKKLEENPIEENERGLL